MFGAAAVTYPGQLEIEEMALRQAHRCVLVRTTYARGRRFEWRVRSALVALGWTVLRSAKSGTAVDLVAFRPERIAIIQVKRSGQISPRERDALARFANGSRAEVYMVRAEARRLEVRDVSLWQNGWSEFTEIF